MLDNMYTDIGSKIKIWAKWTFICEAIGSVIGAISIFATGDDDLFVYAFITLFCGPIVAWVSSWLLYGFGELIDNSQKVADTVDCQLVPAVNNLARTVKVLSEKQNNQTVSAKKSVEKTIPQTETIVEEMAETPEEKPVSNSLFAPTTLSELVKAKNDGIITAEIFEQKLNSMYWSGRITEAQFLEAQK